jgi:uncharacterized membrane protein HdeD (DUF308 family)
MDDQPERVRQFTDEIESMKLKASSSDNERRLLALGVIAAVAGIVLVVIGGIQVQNTSDVVQQTSALATGTYIGIALLVAGVALFIRYSLARYLRFWLIRLVWESRANTDRIVEAIDRAANPPAQ